ncbi:MAG: SDR family NAD(P)-dependent oxidoreductase [bacterium]|nr:SDR family NAD(P)-dependent oxidoreductase [bacterium]
MTHKIALVTGANGGIGQAVASELAGMGITVVLVCRDEKRGEEAKANIQALHPKANLDLMIADLSSQQSIRDLANRFMGKYPHLDILINNAAVHKSKHTLTVDGLETMFATNHLGYFLLTLLLMDKLKASDGARVLNVTAPSTSQLDFDDLQGEKQFNPLVRFGMSKMANLLFTFALAQKLANTSISVYAIHPGLVKSGILREANIVIRTISRAISKTPEYAAKGIVQVATSPEFSGKTGGFFTYGKPIKAPDYAQDTTIQQRLWDISLKLTNTTF